MNGDVQHNIGISTAKSLSLSNGKFVKTKLGWEGIITTIDETSFRFGQGVSVIRIGDNAKFCIHPTDIHNVIV